MSGASLAASASRTFATCVARASRVLAERLSKASGRGFRARFGGGGGSSTTTKGGGPPLRLDHDKGVGTAHPDRVHRGAARSGVSLERPKRRVDEERRALERNSRIRRLEVQA